MMQSPEPAARPRVCFRCGAPFDCSLGSDCWCAAEFAKLPLPVSQAEDCLCPACLRKAAAVSA